MNRFKWMTACLAGFALLGCAGGDFRPPAPASGKAPGPTSSAQKALLEDDCEAKANEQVPGWRSEGMTDREVEGAYEDFYASCTGELDPLEAHFTGLVNMDLLRASMQVISMRMTPTDFIAYAKDRVRKVKQVRMDPEFGWEVLVMGDEDGDLVPDTRDACPGSPDLSATDDNGCPLSPNEPKLQGPDPQTAQRALRLYNFASDPNCVDAPNPDQPQPVKIGYGDGTANVAVTRVTNQPPGCTTMYEFDVELRNDNWVATSQHAPEYPHIVFMQNEAVPSSAIPAGVLRFEANSWDTKDLGARQLLNSMLGQFQHVSWRVRALNGNGQRSAWSGWQRLVGYATGSSTSTFTVP